MLRASLPPLQLDVLQQPWPLPPGRPFDAIYCANMLHIAPWACCTGLMQGAARHLAPGGHLVTYGPYLEDGVPIQLEDRFVNPQVVPDFAQQDFTQQQPSEFLVRTVPFDEIEHVVDAVLPTPEQAQRLQMDAAEPCLLLTRRTWTQGVPVTLVRCLHPASRYRLGSRYSASGNPMST